MLLSRARLELYDADELTVERATAQYVREQLEQWFSEHELTEGTVRDARNAAIDIVTSAVESYGDVSSLLASEFYEDLAKSCGEDVAEVEIKALDYERELRETAHYQACKISDAQQAYVPDFIEGMARFARDQVARSANESMSAAASRDGVMFARVPVGNETCTFCMKLAAKGFIYKTAAAAGEGHKYHVGCRCKVVPGFDGLEVEGYDTAELTERYEQFEKLDSDSELSEAQREKAKRALNEGADYDTAYKQATST